MPRSVDPNTAQDWTDWSQSNLPSWCGNDNGPFSELVGICLIMAAGVLSQANDLAAVARYVNYSASPDDILPYLGKECGLPQYISEDNASYRKRLQQKWTKWQSMCNGSSVQNELSYALGFYAQFVSAATDFNLPGGGGYTDGSNIPSYPPSSVWPFQFLSSIVLSGPIGSGAEGRSVLISDAQLTMLRFIIGLTRPADWAPREIIITMSPLSERYDIGLKYDNGLYYDPPTESVLERFHC